ncbi:hypothetical protein ABE222_23235 [Bacillus tropicus]|uniref:hypothetical protein n=1 Tax=Bacillus tropicus TaxID=2026188 RepID=UPI003D22B4B4
MNKKRLKDDQKDYFKKILYESLDFSLSKKPNKFFQSITDNHIKKDGKLTPDQLKYLPKLFSSLDEKGKEAFENVIKVRLRTYEHQKQTLQTKKGNTKVFPFYSHSKIFNVLLYLKFHS